MVFKRQTHFLLRGSVLLICLLIFWRSALLRPMVYLLKSAAGVFLSIEETSSGAWTLRVPLEKTLPPTAQQSVLRQIHFIDIEMTRTDVTMFIFSLPVYWAILLAAPGTGRSILPPLVLGTLIMSAAEIALLLGYAEITALSAASQVTGTGDAAEWVLRVGFYLVVNVLPYVVPFIVALSLHRGLRSEVFFEGSQ